MTDSYTIFDYIVKDENSLTALLCNYLRFDFFRTEILNLFQIPADIKKNITYDDFSIQYSIGEHGRPDLTIVNKDLAVYVEIKTNDFRSVTDNQPSGYLASLQKAKVKHKKLVFLIPENYYYTEAIEEKANKAKDISIQTITWNDIIDVIHSKKLNEIYPLFHEYLTFLEYYFKPKKIIFMPKELETTFNADFANGLDKTLHP